MLVLVLVLVLGDQVIEQSITSDDRERVRDFLAREDVQDQLALLGVDPDELPARDSSSRYISFR